jgi:hypothetical protein
VTLDPRLLEQAKAAGDRLSAAERQALLARADYHTAIRRLHLAGASFREIADALAISHQRVQQVVRSAGGTWWNRVWRTRRMPADAVCTWCQRPPADVEKLVAGPRVFICDRCIASAERARAGGRTSGPFSGTRTSGLPRACAFCGNRASRTRELVQASAGAVCADCLRVCREIVDASTPA